MTDVKDRVVLVTGATGGIGRALVHAFVSAGMRVGICDIDANAAMALAATLATEFGGDRAVAVPADITDPAACTASCCARRKRPMPRGRSWRRAAIRIICWESIPRSLNPRNGWRDR